MFMHINGKARVKWSKEVSEYFNVSNGVRQGSLLSPYLFSIYIDELIEKPEKSGKGCWVGKQFYGVLVYADDIKLLAPSLTALQSMVDMCKRFGDKNDLFFKSKKTMCIKFHESAKCSPIVQYPITLSGKQLKWFSSVKHLGHISDCCLSFTKGQAKVLIHI